MAESIQFSESSTRAERYEELKPQIEALITPESDLIANLANISAVLSEGFGFLWVGFYIRKDQELVLGPFQGPVACTRIQIGKGVCGSAAAHKETIIVADVEQFPGHIACSDNSKSEIVVPLIVRNQTQLVLDIDSDKLNDFNIVDKVELEKIITLIKKLHFDEAQ